MRRETRDGCSPGHSKLMRAIFFVVVYVLCGVVGVLRERKQGVEPSSVCNRAKLPQILVFLSSVVMRNYSRDRLADRTALPVFGLLIGAVQDLVDFDFNSSSIHQRCQ
jgi:hypothetical protein